MSQHEIDSLIANEFALEIDGETVTGIFSITNLQTYATDVSGARLKPPFVVSKMVQRDASKPFNKWLRESVASRNSDAHPSRNLAILAVDDGVVTRRWLVKGATIVNVAYSDFDSGSFEMVAEKLTIAYDDIEEEWPASS